MQSLKNIFLLLLIAILSQGCQNKVYRLNNQKVQLITLDPGHFHAALLQKSMYSQIDPVVHVYAPGGPELKAHLNLIEKYNTHPENPTSWKEEVYTGADYLEKMFRDRKGNVIVMSGNNQHKSNNIKQAVEKGFNVLADKPMAINSEGFHTLKEAFATAKKNNVLLYDIMTERYEITNILQQEFSKYPELFGKLEKGTLENPAVIKDNMHYFFKYVSGQPLVRPVWFLDEKQAGSGLVDITTHMVDLVQWVCFPDEVLDYKEDIQMLSAKRWETKLTLPQFKQLTQTDNFPNFLQKNVQNDLLSVFSNGEMNYTIKGVHSRISITWDFKAPEGSGDTNLSIMRGTRANLIIRQGKDQQYKPVLYIEPISQSAEYDQVALNTLKTIQQRYPGVSLKKDTQGWQVIIPNEYKINHEAHFAEVVKKYLQYLQTGKVPEWEVPNMLAKYYTTTQALEKAIKK